jgi:PEP-CTERM motif
LTCTHLVVNVRSQFETDHTIPTSTNVLRRFIDRIVLRRFIDRMRRCSMLKRHLVVTGMLVVLALWSASATHAQTIYNLTLENCGGTGCGTSPFGSVTLLQNGGTAVIVTVKLTDTNARFTGSDVLTFDLSSGSGTVSLSGATPDVLTLASGGTQAPFGPFSLAVDCTGGPGPACSGPHTSSSNIESFTLTRTGGLSVSSFIPNSGGYIFTSDITTGTGSGIVAAVTPEPASMLLFGTGLLAIGTVVRRRRMSPA